MKERSRRETRTPQCRKTLVETGVFKSHRSGSDGRIRSTDCTLLRPLRQATRRGLVAAIDRAHSGSDGGAYGAGASDITRLTPLPTWPRLRRGSPDREVPDPVGPPGPASWVSRALSHGPSRQRGAILRREWLRGVVGWSAAELRSKAPSQTCRIRSCAAKRPDLRNSVI